MEKLAINKRRKSDYRTQVPWGKINKMGTQVIQESEYWEKGTDPLGRMETGRMEMSHSSDDGEVEGHRIGSPRQWGLQMQGPWLGKKLAFVHKTPRKPMDKCIEEQVNERLYLQRPMSQETVTSKTNPLSLDPGTVTHLWSILGKTTNLVAILILLLCQLCPLIDQVYLYKFFKSHPKFLA